MICTSHHTGTIRLIACCTVALLAMTPSTSPALGPFDVGAGFMMNRPTDDLRDYVDANATGYGGVVLFQPIPLVPIKVGIEGNYLNYGTRSDTFRALEMDIGLDSKTTTATGLAIVRVQQGLFGFAPYAEGLAGITQITTTANLSAPVPLNNLLKSQKFTTTQFTFGFGAGIMLELFRLAPVVGPTLSLDVNVRYLDSGTSTFTNTASYDLARSSFSTKKADLATLTGRVGLMLGF